MRIQDLQRYIIWGALAAVGFLILIQWQKDYGKQNLESTSEQQQVEALLAAEENTKKQESEDIPTVQKDTKAVFESKELNTTRVITVQSDTLVAKIDLKGGDIIEIKLPKHSVDIEHPDIPVTLLEYNKNRVYVAQSGLVGQDGPDASEKGRPLYTSKRNTYTLEGKNLNVPLSFVDENGTLIEKVFRFSKGSYLIDVTYNVKNNKDSIWKGNVFGQIKRDNTIDPLADTSLFAMKPFLGFAYWSEENKYNKIDLYDVKEEPLNLKHQGGWVAFVQHYFVTAWVAPEGKTNNYLTRVNSNNENIMGFTSESVEVEPGEEASIDIAFYAGPKDQNTLAKISDGLDLTVDYGWLWMVAQLLFAILIFIQSYVGNWGWSIVLLTCFVKLVFFPLNQYAFKSMANMRKLQPKMQRLKEMYGEDRQKLSQATMEMYRKEKINPLGSCLPMLIQMPVFIALYWVLSESVEIRHAAFIGWIKDLSIMDPYFVLPILMALSMFVQQKLSPMVFQDPMQERIMKLMPFMFAFFFLFFPAGLVLYWLVNNILTIAQQWIINKSIDAKST